MLDVIITFMKAVLIDCVSQSQDAVLQMDANLYGSRRETITRSFAEAPSVHCSTAASMLACTATSQCLPKACSRPQRSRSQRCIQTKTSPEIQDYKERMALQLAAAMAPFLNAITALQILGSRFQKDSGHGSLLHPWV